jgi:hypothetical protein
VVVALPPRSFLKSIFTFSLFGINFIYIPKLINTTRMLMSAMVSYWKLFAVFAAFILPLVDAKYPLSGVHTGINTQTGARPARRNVLDFQNDLPSWYFLTKPQVGFKYLTSIGPCTFKLSPICRKYQKMTCCRGFKWPVY